MREFITSFTLAVALVLGLTYGAGVPANAAPVAVTPESEGSGWVTTKASKSQWLVLRLSAATVAHNHSPAHILDYRKAIKYFKTSGSNNISYRRGFAAGWLHSGGVIHHITAGELAKVKAVKNGSAPNAMAPAVTPMAGNGCTGKSAYKIVVSGKEWREWYNSCQVTDIENNFGWVPWTAGGIGLAVAGMPVPAVVAAGAFALLIGAIALHDLHTISHAAANSKYHAIVVTTKDGGENPTNGTHYIDSIIESQNGQYG